MQAHILRKSNGHFTLLFPLTTGEGNSLPDEWSHIELDLGNLRVLCSLPEHPRPEMFELRDPRVSSWLRSQIHSGKVKLADRMNLLNLFEGIYRIEKCPAAPAETIVAAIHEPRKNPVPVTTPKTAANRGSLNLPRSVRRTGRQTSIAARAS